MQLNTSLDTQLNKHPYSFHVEQKSTDFNRKNTWSCHVRHKRKEEVIEEPKEDAGLV